MSDLVELLYMSSKGCIAGALLGVLAGAGMHVVDKVMYKKNELFFTGENGEKRAFVSDDPDIRRAIEKVYPLRSEFKKELDRSLLLTQHAVNVFRSFKRGADKLRSLTRYQRAIGRSNKAWRELLYKAKDARNLIALEQIREASSQLHEIFEVNINEIRMAWRADGPTPSPSERSHKSR